MTNYWTDTVTRLTPYVPGEQRSGDNIIKLNTNENPYPPTPAVMQAVSALTGDQLRLYPDPESVALRKALASYHGLDVSQVFVGNGSDEILALVFLAYFTNDKVLQFPDISYSFYPVYCDLYGIEAKTIALEPDYSINFERYEANAGGIVFPNPNAPTATDVTHDAVRSLLERHTQQVLLVDEAYADFGARSVIDMIDEFPNLLVSHTFSKGRSLAGLRLGVAFGHPRLIEGLQRVKNSFNSYPVDAFAQVAGIASLQDETYYRTVVDTIVKTREQAVSDLHARGFQVLPSKANFLFARVPQQGSEKTATPIVNRLSDAGILVRHWTRPRLDQWLRISLGTPEQMQALMSCLDA